MQPSNPIIVRVVEEPVEATTVADVLLGSLGLAGALILIAALLGVVLGAALIGLKLLRRRWGLEPVQDLQELRVTPGATRQ